ncbi:hypothetical protein Rsub_08964 [Raphidocelis subcapitata]|uniref:LIMR family protein n=1 Tax=Raphidocelis subcapitata TaxID=307507 RepID=A0A2V0P897_9CHLO|nr:hypothetical protein Rsub_08964 [Raphidocelis subcapitata]|eukprot:GBF96088.1 hypothetical protein Rsub_08964 [Raphidocelis subcapitata]
MALAPGFNWLLIFVASIVAVVLLAACVYVLIHYQHPDDGNQAWVPKIIIVLGLWLAMATVLMFPLDVANRAACSFGVAESACVFTLPMRQLWFAAFITNLVMTFFLIPFTMFFWEADSDYTFFMRIKTAALWTLGMAVVLGLSIGVAYGLAGFVEYPTQELVSGLLPLDQLALLSNRSASDCIKPGEGLPGYNATNKISGGLCDGYGGGYTLKTWTLRVSLPVYVMAIQSVFGWILFLVFAGWGVMAAPIDWIHQYMRRPKAVITKSEFINRARGLAQRAKEIKSMSEMLKRQDRAEGRNRSWRSNFRRLQRELLQLEEDEGALDAVFPQGQDGEVKWVLYQLGFLLLGLMGLVGLAVSLLWLIHIVIYMLPPVPIHPMLNEVFLKLDGVFPLFGVAAFAAFCLYLMVVAIKGNFLLGLNFLVVRLYPMRPGATMTSSFLVNVALVLAMSGAVTQFCASAFASYASNTIIFEIFGNDVLYLKGLRYVYQFNVFLYMMLSVAGLSTLWMVVRGAGGPWKRAKHEDAYRP